MRRLPASFAILITLASLAACFGGGDSRFANLPSDSIPLVVGPNDLVITSADSGMDLGVVGDKVILRLSEHMRRDIRASMDSTAHRTGIGASIARAVMAKVGAMMNHRLEYSVADIESVEYTGDRLVFKYRNKHEMTFDDFKTEGRPVLEAFRSEDAMHFVEAFRARKSAGPVPL